MHGLSSELHGTYTVIPAADTSYGSVSGLPAITILGRANSSRNSLLVTQRVTQLLGGIENYGDAPTSWQMSEIKVLQGLLRDAAASARKLTQEDLPALNKMMRDANVPYVAVPVGGGGRPPQ